jgi:ubiquitin
MNRLALLLAALLLVTTTASATQQALTVQNYWKAADKCAKQAQAAFPDYNPESNAKRDAKLKECLNASNLAPRQPLSPAPLR